MIEDPKLVEYTCGYTLKEWVEGVALFFLILNSGFEYWLGKTKKVPFGSVLEGLVFLVKALISRFKKKGDSNVGR
jgi:hypothetical protein